MLWFYVFYLIYLKPIDFLYILLFIVTAFTFLCNGTKTGTIQKGIDGKYNMHKKKRVKNNNRNLAKINKLELYLTWRIVKRFSFTVFFFCGFTRISLTSHFNVTFILYIVTSSKYTNSMFFLF